MCFSPVREKGERGGENVLHAHEGGCYDDDNVTLDSNKVRFLGMMIAHKKKEERREE